MNQKILAYNAVQTRSKMDLVGAATIPQSPRKISRRLFLFIPTSNTANNSENKVEILATIGVRGVSGIAQIMFRIFRDGQEIYNTVQGIESTGSEQNYVVTFQAIDLDVPTGTHLYRLTAENLTGGTTAQVVGPVSFSLLAIRNTDR